MENTVKALRILPGKAPEACELGTKLEDLQEAVEGYIEFTYPFDDSVLVIGNEEAKMIGMKGNRRINGAIYAGPIYVIGDDGEGDLTSLTDDQVKKYTEMFKEPEDIPDEETQADVGFTFIELKETKNND